MSKNIFFKTLLFLIIFSLIIISPRLVRAQTSPPIALTTQLLNLAQAKLNAEYDVLTTGDSTKLIKANLLINDSAAQRTNEMADLQLRRNKSLAEHGQSYTAFSSKLKVKNIETSTDATTITADENVTLTLIDKNTKDPVYTKEIKTHAFRFTDQAGTWYLSEDKEVNPLGPVPPEGGQQKISDKPLSLLEMNKTSAADARNKLEATTPENKTPISVLSGTYNPENAANYAKSYWSNYNSAYRAYGNDCTNFISQAMNWGGWQHNGGWYDDPNFWWYSPGIVIPWGGRAEARSWINVHYFYFFARYSGRAYNAGSFSDFRVGDTIQVDFGPTPDGWLDHNTMVTQNNGNGNIFLTYHTNNTLNKSIWDFAALAPGANYYGTLLYYQY